MGTLLYTCRFSTSGNYWGERATQPYVSRLEANGGSTDEVSARSGTVHG